MIAFKKIFPWLCNLYSEVTGTFYIVKRDYGKFYKYKYCDGSALGKQFVISDYMNYAEASILFEKLVEEDNLYQSIYLKRVNLRTGKESVVLSLRW